jgi:hypothetical protein
MIKHALVAAGLALAPLLALAQAASAPQSPPAPAASPASPAKKALVAKVLQIQQGSIENIGSSMAQQSIAPLLQQLGPAIQQRVPAEKRQAVADAVQADLKKYVAEVEPLLRERAVKLAPATVGALLEERFTEDELKSLVALLESPVQRKYAQMNNELGQALAQKVAADARAQVDPKLAALQQGLTKRLTDAAAPAASGPRK